jgi:uncharacterized membrane protein YeiH
MGLTVLNELAPRFATVVEHAAIAVAAIGGVLAARGKDIDLFGVLVLALVTAFGGGTVRDLLVGDRPVAWLRDVPLVATAVLATIVTFFLAPRLKFPAVVFLVADAFSLALYTALGAQKALRFEVAPVLAVVMGVITGVAGGILRDVLTQRIPLVFQSHVRLYATASMLGAAIFVLLVRVPGCGPFAGVVSIAVTLLLRLAALRWKLSLPIFNDAERKIES